MTKPERIDPHDTIAFDEWFDVFTDAVDHGREFPTAPPREDLRASVLRADEYHVEELYGLRDDAGELVGTLYVELPTVENTNLLTATIGVRPDRRRRGIGTALATYLDELAATRGRTNVIGEVDVALGGTAPGQAFAARHGYTVANTEVHRVLELPVAAALLDDLAADAAPHHPGYRLESWVDRCPDDLVEPYVALLSAFLEQAPLGDLEVEPEVWDAARLRNREERTKAQGRTCWTTVAVAPDGSLVGNSELGVPVHDPGKVFQWGTLVMPGHRGRRLGVAMKARNHRELQAKHPEPAVAHTWNGEQNTNMNAVNALLGYRPVELCQEWQKHL